ncbi:MAG: hypothetical protein JXA95_15320 [Spirochaetales bacterium]|nr:hypothetical protein [Spirochaetales bacterium]
MKRFYVVIVLFISSVNLFSNEGRGLFLQIGLGTSINSYIFAPEITSDTLMNSIESQIDMFEHIPLSYDLSVGYSFFGNTYLTGSLFVTNDTYGRIDLNNYDASYKGAIQLGQLFLGAGFRTYPYETGFFWGSDLMYMSHIRDLYYLDLGDNLDQQRTIFNNGMGVRVKSGYDFDKNINGLSFSINFDAFASYIEESIILGAGFYGSIVWK